MLEHLGDIIFCLVFLSIIGFVSFLRNPKGKGWLGELLIRFLIGTTKYGEKYVINNLIVADENGHTSQIDHIVINRGGIYVIETKNYSGRIYGSEHDKEWTQVLKFGKVKYKHYNPLRQNATHIYRLSEKLNTKENFHSVIIFIQENIKYIKAPGVITPWGLKKAITPNDVVLTPGEMENYYNTLKEIKSAKKVTEAQHIANAQKTIKKVEENICPRCGGKLVERNGKYGKFCGCENFPKCRFIKK